MVKRHFSPFNLGHRCWNAVPFGAEPQLSGFWCVWRKRSTVIHEYLLRSAATSHLFATSPAAKRGVPSGGVVVAQISIFAFHNSIGLKSFPRQDPGNHPPLVAGTKRNLWILPAPHSVLLCSSKAVKKVHSVAPEIKLVIR